MSQRIRKTVLFVGLTFFISWTLLALFFLLGGKWKLPAATLLLLAYMLVPMSVALFVQGVVFKEPVKQPFGISLKLNRWFLVAWLFPIAVTMATLGISLLLPGIEYSADSAGLLERLQASLTEEQFEEIKEAMDQLPLHPFWIGLLQGLVAGPTVNALVAFGEELGWRGLLEKETRSLGFWRQSGLIGLIWGIWHAPVILLGHNYPEHPRIGVFMMIIFTILWTPIHVYVKVKAASIFAAAVLHGSVNATAGLSMMLLKGGNDLTTGLTGLPGLLVLAGFNLVWFVTRRPGDVARPNAPTGGSFPETRISTS